MRDLGNGLGSGERLKLQFDSHYSALDFYCKIKMILLAMKGKNLSNKKSRLESKNAPHAQLILSLPVSKQGLLKKMLEKVKGCFRTNQKKNNNNLTKEWRKNYSNWPQRRLSQKVTITMVGPNSVLWTFGTRGIMAYYE